MIESDWQVRQNEFRKTGTRYYGDGGTVHNSIDLDIETYNGEVIAVWFRCQHLPFKQFKIDECRKRELERYPATVELHGVEVRDK
jgi:hypothetical protein